MELHKIIYRPACMCVCVCRSVSYNIRIYNGCKLSLCISLWVLHAAALIFYLIIFCLFPLNMINFMNMKCDFDINGETHTLMFYYKYYFHAFLCSFISSSLSVLICIVHVQINDAWLYSGVSSNIQTYTPIDEHGQYQCLDKCTMKTDKCLLKRNVFAKAIIWIDLKIKWFSLNSYSFISFQHKLI